MFMNAESKPAANSTKGEKDPLTTAGEFEGDIVLRKSNGSKIDMKVNSEFTRYSTLTRDKN